MKLNLHRRPSNKVGHFKLNGKKIEVFKDEDGWYDAYDHSDDSLLTSPTVDAILIAKRYEHANPPPFGFKKPRRGSMQS